MAIANRWLFEEMLLGKLAEQDATRALVSTTTALTMLEAGEKENVLPHRARAVINTRIVPGESVQSVHQRLVRTVDDERVQVSLIGGMGSEPSPISAIEGSQFGLLQKTIGQLFPGVLVAPSFAPDVFHHPE